MVTKTKTSAYDMGSSPGRREDSRRAEGAEVGPGAYDNNYKWGNDSKGFTIGEKRETRIETTVGPGDYDMNIANSLTKPKGPQVSMGSSASRPERVGQIKTQSQSSLSLTKQRNSFGAST